jgi:hypothetical protein
MRIGTTALGLKPKWRFGFVKPGLVVSPTRGTVYLDVGGQLCPGIIDQHQNGSLARSTTELIVRHPDLVYEHLLGPWLDRRDAGVDLSGANFEPLLVTHVEPDFDAMVSCWLVQRLIEDGDLPPSAEAWMNYGALVDQGRYVVNLDKPTSATEAIHIAYLAIQHLGIKEPAQRLELGFALIDCVMAHLTQARGHLYGLRVEELFPAVLRTQADLQTPQARAQAAATAAWRNDPRFEKARILIDADLEKYQRDKRAASIRQVSLPTEDGRSEVKVNVFIAADKMESALSKYWVRADGCPYFICPVEPIQAGVSPRVILSLDPSWVDPDSGRKPTLRGLGFRLEQAECQARAGRPELDRGLPPRYPDGTCDNADPWYDGRGHEHTIVDAPRSKTVLSYETITRMGTSAFWEVGLKRAEVLIALPLDKPAQDRALHPWVSPPKYSEATPCFARFIEASKEANYTPESGLKVDDSLPTGMERIAYKIRRMPITESPDFALLKFRSGDGDKPTLEDLVRFLAALHVKHDGRVYSVVNVQFEEGAAAICDRETLLGRLCPDAGVWQEHSDDLILCNGRIIAVNETHPIADEVRSRRLLELMVYVAFQIETLQTYSAEIVKVLDKSRGSGGDALRRGFLTFHASYVHQDIVFNGEAREMYAKLHDSLRIGDLHTKTIEDLERLAELEVRRGEKKTNLLLFIVGLTGLVEAGTTDFFAVPPFQLILVVLAIVASIIVYWVMTRNTDKPGELTSGDKGA